MSSNTAILLKKSGVSGNTPLNLEHGEIAINYAEGKLYYKNDSDVIKHINNQESFSTIIANGELILATSPTDILNIVAGNNIDISTNTATKTITINSLADNNIANLAFDKANSANSLAQAAFDAANNAHGVTSITIQDSGTTISDHACTINFIGATVTSSNSGYGVDVTFGGGGGGGGFPLIDLGLVTEPATTYDLVDFGTLP